MWGGLIGCGVMRRVSTPEERVQHGRRQHAVAEESATSRQLKLSCWAEGLHEHGIDFDRECWIARRPAGQYTGASRFFPSISRPLEERTRHLTYIKSSVSRYDLAIAGHRGEIAIVKDLPWLPMGHPSNVRGLPPWSLRIRNISIPNTLWTVSSMAMGGTVRITTRKWMWCRCMSIREGRVTSSRRERLGIPE